MRWRSNFPGVFFNIFSSTKYATGTSSKEMEEVKAANVSKMKNRVAHN